MDFLQSISNFFNPNNLVAFVQNPKALWYVLGFVFFIYAIVSAVLAYHWRTYGMGSRLILKAEVFYFTISISLFVLAIIFIILI